MITKLLNKISGKLLGTGISRYIPFSSQIYNLLYSKFNKADLVEVEIPRGRKLKVWSNDSGFGAFLIHKREYEPFQTKLMVDAAKNKKVFFDVGANAGYYTVLLSDLVEKVISFEPSQDNALLLQTNVELNNLSNVSIEQKALGPKQGKLKFRESKYQKGHSGLVKQGNFDYEVSVDTLDSYISKNVAPDLIKVDIEGAEADFLRGAKDFLSSSKNLELFIEYHPQNIKAFGHAPEDIVNLLKEYGFNIEIINEANSSLEKFSNERLKEVVGKYGYTNFYCCKQL
jgi:FkbM family methyltransferase